MALYIDDNDNINKTFVGHIISFAPSLRSGANDATRATNKQYVIQKSSYCPIYKKKTGQVLF